MRKCVPLKPIERDESRPIPNFAVCDIEARNWIEFLTIGYYTKITEKDEVKDEYRHFESLDEFCDFCFSASQQRDVIIAHFGGKYDFNFILKAFYIRHEKYFIHKMIPRGSGLLSFYVSTYKRAKKSEVEEDDEVIYVTRDGEHFIEERRIEFRDSSGLLPHSLASLAENFKVEHQKLEIDYDKITEVTPELLKYLEYDCRALYECLEKFYSQPLIRGAGAASTMASQALKVYRTFMTNEIKSLAPDVDDFVRNAYFGGRTEIFKPFYVQDHDKSMLRCFDVNSLYPSVMRDNEFPVRLKKETNKFDDSQMGFYEVTVNVPDMYIPPLGSVFSDGNWGRFIFPTGTFRGFWTSEELKYAMSLGVKILKVHKGLVFSSGGHIFKDYIEHLYDVRKKAVKGSVDDMVAKLLMNSTYGRFGLQLEREQLEFDQGQMGVDPYLEFHLKDNLYFRIVKRDVILDSTFSNCAIACWTTSLARILMHKQYVQASDDLYYTDSVTEDRMVMVKDQDDLISVKSMKELWSLSTNEKSKSTKESAELNYLTLSYNSSSGSWEWRKIQRIIRHNTNKIILSSRSNKGASVTTEDHSFINEYNEKLNPYDVKSHFSPKTFCVPRGKTVNEIDLWDWIDNSDETLKTDGIWIWAKASDSAKRKYEPIKIKRHYADKELENLCKLIGYYVTEGSVSLGKRHMFSISSEKYEFQEELRKFLNRSLSGSEINHIKSSNKDNCYALRSGTKTMVYVFLKLFGRNSKTKKLPDFVFNLSESNQKALIDSLVLGDGSIIFGKAYSTEYKQNNFRFCSQSFTLINQICALLSFSGRCYSIQFRKDKSLWTIATSNKNLEKAPRLESVDYKGYVYDLQVEENNNFFDCEGLIGLHNTDSLFSTHKYPQNDNDLGKLKLEYKAKSACFLLPKTYAITGINPYFDLLNSQGAVKDEKGKKIKTNVKVVMKGFDKKKISHFNVHDFYSALEGDLKRLSTTNPKKFATLRTAARKNKFLMLLEESPREIRSRYDKRRIIKRNWSQKYDTEPLHIKNGVIVNKVEQLKRSTKRASKR